MIRYVLVLIFVFASCTYSRQDNSAAHEINPRVEAIQETELFLSQRLGGISGVAAGGGKVVFTRGEYSWLVDPACAFTGLIDGNETEDAWVTIQVFQNNEPADNEHLVFLNSGSKLVLAKSFVRDMKILKLKDRVITGEVHTHDRSSPLYDCESCLDVVQYRLSGDSLVAL